MLDLAQAISWLFEYLQAYGFTSCWFAIFNKYFLWKTPHTHMHMHKFHTLTENDCFDAQAMYIPLFHSRVHPLQNKISIASLILVKRTKVLNIKFERECLNFYTILFFFWGCFVFHVVAYQFSKWNLFKLQYIWDTCHWYCCRWCCYCRGIALCKMMLLLGNAWEKFCTKRMSFSSIQIPN